MIRRPTLDEMMLADAGRGIDPADAYWWLDRNTDFELIQALEAFDEFHNLEPLKALLCRDRPASWRWLIDDFFARHPLKNRRGPKGTPKYDRTKTMQRLLRALDEIGYHRADGASLDEAIDLAAQNNDVAKSTLRAAHDRKHGGLNRTRPNNPRN
jgi:hypothetical protein